MPVVTIVSNPLSAEQRRELVRDVTEACARVMRLPAQTIVSVFF